MNNLSFRILATLSICVVAILSGPANTQESRGPADNADTANSSDEQRVVNSIKARGIVRSAIERRVNCELESKSYVVMVIEEGTVVQKGDRIADLDSSALELELNRQQITEAVASSDLKKAESALATKTKALERLSSLAVLAPKALELDADLKKTKAQVEAESVSQRVKLTESKIQLAEEREIRTKKLFQDQAVSKLDVEEVELKVAEIRADLRLLMREKELVNRGERRDHVWGQFQRSQVMHDLQSQIEDSQAAVEELRERLETAGNRLYWEQKRLKKLKTQISACHVKAPIDGVVMFKNRRSQFRDRIIEEGAEIHPKQTIAYIVDPTKLELETFLPSTEVARLRVGDSASIVVHAAARSFAGSIATISPVPWLQRTDLRQSIDERGEPRYRVTITISKPSLDVRIGFQADAVFSDFHDRSKR